MTALSLKKTRLRKSRGQSYEIRIWNCKCDCGKIFTQTEVNIANGKVLSCGCKLNDKTNSFYKPSLEIQREYEGMVSRCKNSKSISYKNYGGRGIKICDEWLNNINAFCDSITHLKGYCEENVSLDRIDNEGNYEPNNIRWADRTEQSRNRRNVHKYTINGNTYSLPQIAEKYGLSKDLLLQRVEKGMDINKAIMNIDFRRKENKNVTTNQSILLSTTGIPNANSDLSADAGTTDKRPDN